MQLESDFYNAIIEDCCEAVFETCIPKAKGVRLQGYAPLPLTPTPQKAEAEAPAPAPASSLL